MLGHWKSFHDEDIQVDLDAGKKLLLRAPEEPEEKPPPAEGDGPSDAQIVAGFFSMGLFKGVAYVSPPPCKFMAMKP